jgi:hypothetical protein
MLAFGQTGFFLHGFSRHLFWRVQRTAHMKARKIVFWKLEKEKCVKEDEEDVGGSLYTHNPDDR